MNELDTLARWAVPALLAVIAFFVREMVHRVKEIGDRVQAHAVSLSVGNQRFGEHEKRLAKVEARLEALTENGHAQQRGTGA